MKERLQTKLPASHLPILDRCIDAYTAEQIRKYRLRPTPEVSDSEDDDSVEQDDSTLTQNDIPVSEVVLPDTQMIPEPQPKPRGGSNNMPGRLDLRRMQCASRKLDLLIELHGQIPASKTELTEGARYFVERQLTPVIGCLQYHFNGDKEAFLANYGGKLNHSQFEKQMCRGYIGVGQCTGKRQ